MSTSPDAQPEAFDHTADSGQLEGASADADSTASAADTQIVHAPEAAEHDDTLAEPDQPIARHEAAAGTEHIRPAVVLDTAQHLGHRALAKPADATEAASKAVARAFEGDEDSAGDADMAAGSSGQGGDHDGPEEIDADGSDKKGDDESERGTVSVAQLKQTLDNIATYGVREAEDDATLQVNFAAMQARLDAAEAVEDDSLVLDTAELAALQRAEPKPSQLDKLYFFDDTAESRQPVADRILAERALSLLPVTQRDILIRAMPMGGSQDTETIAAETGKTVSNVQQIRWHAQNEYTRLAGEIERGELDLERYRDEHPKSRSPLTMLRGLDQTIEPDARMNKLCAQGLMALNQTRLNAAQKVAMAHLYGLYPGRHPMSTVEVAKVVGLQRATSIVNMERVMYGEQSPNYHPGRQAGGNA